MRPGDIMARAVRLTQIQHLLHQNPGGVTAKELAAPCGVCVRTRQRDLITLQTDLGIPFTEECDRYLIAVGYPANVGVHERGIRSRVALACAGGGQETLRYFRRPSIF